MTADVSYIYVSIIYIYIYYIYIHIFLLIYIYIICIYIYTYYIIYIHMYIWLYIFYARIAPYVLEALLGQEGLESLRACLTWLLENLCRLHTGSWVSCLTLWTLSSAATPGCILALRFVVYIYPVSLIMAYIHLIYPKPCKPYWLVYILIRLIGLYTSHIP